MPELTHRTDVLNRCPFVQTQVNASHEHAKTSAQQTNRLNTRKVMMYMFPRQFGLHNVFTSQVDFTQTAQRFQDYTLREEEIGKRLKASGADKEHPLPKVPKRLRGLAEELAQRLQILHRRCSYWEMLRYYCSALTDDSTQTEVYSSIVPRRSSQHRSGSAATASQPCKSLQQKRRRKPRARFHRPAATQYSTVTEIATPPAQVSAFCRATLLKIIPRGFWGAGDTGTHNIRAFSRKVDHFIKLRRFETMSLHEIFQDIKVRQTCH
jgi:telomerase reverse transcriptase